MAKKSSAKKAKSGQSAASRGSKAKSGNKAAKAIPPKKSVKAAGAAKAGKAASVKPEPPKAAPPRLAQTPFSKTELAEYRKLLIDKRRSILGDMGGIEAEALRTNRQDSSGDLSNMPTHPADIGTDNYEQEFTLELLESERTLLTEINEALERINKRTYGICLGTGEFIGKARLKARPWAKYCIDYARKLEKGLVKPPTGETSSTAEGEQEEEAGEEVAETEEPEAPEEEVEVEEEVEE